MQVTENTALAAAVASKSDGLPLELGADEIHLWFTFLDELDSPDLQERYRRILSAQERLQEQRFHFARDRRRYLVTRVLTRTILSRYAPVSPQEWRFTSNAYGRPVISEQHASAAHLVFNISHTTGLVLLGVTSRQELGVDVENFQTRTAPLELADRFFAPEEQRALRAVEPASQPERFFHYWTLKESYIKARGMGLSLPLDRFHFQLPGAGGLRFDCEPSVGDTPEGWHFWLLAPSPQHIAAICARPQAQRNPRLILKQAVPLLGEQPLPCTGLRRSHTARDETGSFAPCERGAIGNILNLRENSVVKLGARHG